VGNIHSLELVWTWAYAPGWIIMHKSSQYSTCLQHEEEIPGIFELVLIAGIADVHPHQSFQDHHQLCINQLRICVFHFMRLDINQ